MNDKLLHTPEGVRDIHFNEAQRKYTLQNKVMTIFHRYGYKDVQTPTFEYMDVFNNKFSTIDVKDLYKFFDREGNILVLRPDVTPSIARLVATNYTTDNSPKRFCYIGNTFRNVESYQLKLKEFTQAGVELVGTDTEDADAEIIALTIHALQAAGLKEFQIDIGQAGFIKGILEETGLDPALEATLKQLIDEKNYIAVEELLEEKALEADKKQILLDLPKLFGDVTVIERARQRTQNPVAREALNRLEKIYAILKDYGVEKYISFDLGMVSQINYYTGIIFRGYTYGTGVSIVDGGRYDTLIEAYGYNAPAVGFAIVIDEVMNSIERQNIAMTVPRTDTLLLYNQTTRAMAIKIAHKMRSEGMNLEIGLLEAGLEENIAYGKQQKIGGILHFTTATEVTLIDLTTDKTEQLDVKTLLEDR